MGVVLLSGAGPGAEAATLAGRLVNKTPGGQGVGGVEVTLTPYQGGREQPGNRTARTDAQGRFRFADLQAGSGWNHGVTVRYQGGEYPAGPVTFDGGAAERTIEVPVYDGTTDARGLKARVQHVILDPVQAGVRATEALLTPEQLTKLKALTRPRS